MLTAYIVATNITNISNRKHIHSLAEIPEIIFSSLCNNVETMTYFLPETSQQVGKHTLVEKKNMLTYYLDRERSTKYNSHHYIY